MLRRMDSPKTVIGSEAEIGYHFWRVEAKMVIQEALHWRSFVKRVKRKLCCPWRRWNIGGEDNTGPISRTHTVMWRG
jgi:hypothetical protein